jgi:hypothetical protein
MITSFFISVAFNWYLYYLLGYAICLRRLYETQEEVEVVEVKTIAADPVERPPLQRFEAADSLTKKTGLELRN